MNNNLLTSMVYSSVICVILSFAANAGSTIQNAVELWAQNGQNFSNLNSCSMYNEIEKKHLFIYASTTCLNSELATYSLLKGCANSSNINQISILDVNTEKHYLIFEISPETCEYLTTQLNRVQSSLGVTYANTNKHYVIQFYAGYKAPTSRVGRCADIPLYQHIENNMFYLMSKAYARYSEAKKLMDSINEKCPDIDLWVRPISIIQY